MTDQPPTDTSDPPTESPAKDEEREHVVARYGRMKHIGMFRHDLDPPPKMAETVVLRTDRGAELGKVLACVGGSCSRCLNPRSLNSYVAACGSDYPFGRKGKVLRIATPQDFNDQQHLDRSASEEAGFCRQQIASLGMDMKIVDVEHLLGGERIVFFFTAEHRVDFRELVRKLAAEYHTRIEMRQVGARDEARLVADYERCGRRCCCQEFLKFLKPVSMRMAKPQKATLDPAKISGRCGRLMCCLRYEDAIYAELAASLPRKNMWIRTAEDVVAKVADVQVLTQLVRLILPDRTHAVVHNDEIIERDIPEPSPEEMVSRREPLQEAPAPGASRAAAKVNAEEPQTDIRKPAADKAGVPSEQAEGKPKRRKRGRGRRGKDKPAARPEALSAPPQSRPKSSAQAPSPSGSPEQKAAGEGGEQPKPKRKRRRRRRKPRGQRGQANQNTQGGSGGTKSD